MKPELHPRPAIEWFHLAYIWTHSWEEGRHVFLNEDGTWERTCFSYLCNFLPGSRRFLSSYSLETKCFMYIKPGQNQVLPLKGTGATSCLHHPLCWRKNRDGCFICTFLVCACQRYTSALPKQVQNDNKAKRYLRVSLQASRLLQRSKMPFLWNLGRMRAVLKFFDSEIRMQLCSIVRVLLLCLS